LSGRKHPSNAAPLAAIGLGVTLLLSACAEAPGPADRLTLTPMSFAGLPGWSDDPVSAAIPPLRLSCDRRARASKARSAGGQGIAGSRAQWDRICAAAHQLAINDDARARAFFERHFKPHRASNGADPEGLFTGYYEAELKGALRPSARYNVPIYAQPDDLIAADLGEFRDDLKGRRIAGRVVAGRLRPYEDRAAIEAGALKERGRAIVWVDDAVDAFFLHIQGSGRVVLDDGRIMRIGYAGQNGHAYFAIGRDLVRRGEVSKADISMQAIRAWLKAHPGETRALLEKNRSYVFFHELKGPGPIGAEGVPLTPGRSLAIDRVFVPFGVPIWLDAADPARPKDRIRRLLISQDTGGAIKGPVRGDVFWGFGPKAAARAGRMKHIGAYFLLLPRAKAAGPVAAR
jgi:membrane-bound lytic murein transglycosylase A